MKHYLKSILFILILFLSSILLPCCDKKEEKISSPFGPKKIVKVKITYDYKINSEIIIPEGLKGSVSADMDTSTTEFETPVHPEGKVLSLAIGEMPIDIKNTELDDGNLSTKGYGNIEFLLIGLKQGKAVFELRATQKQIVCLTKDIIKYLDNKKDIFNAVMDNDIPKLQKLIEAKVDLNVRTVDDITPLMVAAIMGSQKAVQTLLDANADVNAKDHTGWTALIHFASTNGNLEMGNTLINAHADINARGKHGTTALIMAAIKGNMDLVKTLVEAGADLNAEFETTGERFTALYAAERGGHKEVAEFLKNSGAN